MHLCSQTEAAEMRGIGGRKRGCNTGKHFIMAVAVGLYKLQ